MSSPFVADEVEVGIDGLNQLACVPVPFARISLQALADDGNDAICVSLVLNRLAQLCSDVIGNTFLTGSLGHNVHAGTAVMNGFTSQAHVEGRTQRVDVSRRRDGLLIGNLLRSHEVRRAQDGAVLTVLGHEFWQRIEHHWALHPMGHNHHHIVRLEIAVNDAGPVVGADAIADITE